MNIAIFECRMSSWLAKLVLTGVALPLMSCDDSHPAVRGDGLAAESGTPATWSLPPVPDDLAPSLAAELEQRRTRVLTNPEHAEVVGELGVFYEANEMRPEALALYRRARELDPTDPHWPTHEAWILGQDGELEAALALLDAALERHPEFAPLWSQTGSIARQLGQLEGAEQAYRELIRIAPERSEGHLGLAETWLAAGRAADALPEVELALERDPEYRRIHYVRGLVYRDLGRLEDAQRELALGAQARVRRMGDRWSEALMTWSHSRTARLTVAIQMQAQGRVRDALAHLEETLALGPDDARTLTQIGLAHRALGDLDRAIEFVRAAVEIAPDAYQTRLNLGQMLLEQGLVEEAITEAAEAVRAGPGVAKARMLAADAFFAAGREDEALAALEAALERAPTNPEMHAYAAQRLLSVGRAELALRHLEAVLRAHPHDPVLVDLLAAAQVDLGRDEDAAASRQRASGLRAGARSR